MLILGVDPGSRVCGYGLIRSLPGGRLQYLGAGVIQARNVRPLPGGRAGRLPERLLEIGVELEIVCEEAKAQLGPDEPIHAAIESGYIDKHGPTVLVLGAARGVAMYVLRRTLACEVREYAPSSVKKAVSGSGKASKEQVARMVMLRLKMNRPPDADAADALAVAIARSQDSG